MSRNISQKDGAICRECGEQFPNRFMLGKHYTENPTHKHKPGFVSPKAQKAIDALIAKGIDPLSSPTTNGKKSPRKQKKMLEESTHLLKFCPCCGTNIQQMEIALAFSTNSR